MIHQNSKEHLKEGYSASTFQVYVDMAEVWFWEIKTKLSASPKETEWWYARTGKEHYLASFFAKEIASEFETSGQQKCCAMVRL